MTEQPTTGDTPTPQPPSRLEAIERFIGNLARPFSIVSTSAAASWATVAIALKLADKSDSFEAAAIFIGAVYAGVAGLYGFKAWEQAKVGRHAAEVEIAKAGTPAAADPPPATVADDPAMYGGPRP